MLVELGKLVLDVGILDVEKREIVSTEEGEVQNVCVVVVEINMVESAGVKEAS